MARKTPGIYIAIRGDYSAFETDLNAAKKLAKAQGDAIAKSINNAVSAVDLTGGINKLTRELKTAQAALSAGAFKGQVSGLEEIAKAAGVSSKQLEGLTNSMLKSQAAATANRAFEYLQKNAGLSTLQLAKLRAELGDTSGALSTLASGAKANAVGLLAFGAAAAMAGKQVLDATLQMDRLNKAYGSITGSSAAAQSQLDYIYDVTQRLGLQFQGTAEAAKGFFAAGKESPIKDQLNGVFESVSMAGSALALSKDQMDGVFLALGQMISKGKVQAEELRGQLGERLPGAFDAAARAMGVTTAKLDDMLKKGQVTAEEMLPKLAKVLHDDFAIAAAEASQGLQAQLNRLSTEWTRFQASLLNGDAAAKVMGQLASGMKVLADHGAELAAIIGKGIQWAAWTAGVYAAIKVLSGLGTAVTAAKAAIAAVNVSSVAAAVGSLSGLLGPAGLAAAAGAAIVAFTSLSSSTQSADDIFRKHQATIDDYKEKMGKATDAVKTFSEEQEEAYRKSLERQRDILNTDIAAAVGDVNSAVSGVQTFSLDNLYSSKAAALVQARKEVEELGRELAKLGQNVTQDDLNAYAEKVSAIDERMRGAGLATKEWNNMITNLVGEGDSFVLKLAAMIAKSLEIEGTLEQLRQTTANAKGELATGWSIGLEGVDAALDKLDTRLRTAQAKLSNVKGMSDAAGTFKDFSVDQLEVLKKALDTGGRGALIKVLGEQYHVAAGQIQEVSGAMTKYFGRLKVTTEAEEKAAKIEEERRKKHSGKASAIEQTSTKLETLRKEVAALEEANIPAAKSFDQVVAKLELERKNAVAAAEETAKLSVQRKQATATQATEQKALEIRKAELVYTQKLREAEAKRDDELKKNADLRLDFEKRYADMVGLSSEAVSKSISKQAEEYRKAIEAGENAAEELVRLEEWKRDQIQRASRDAMDGAQVALRDYQVEASNQAKSMNDAFRGLFSGMDSGFKNVWQQMLEDGKVSLSSFKSLFASFLADLMHLAITRPITVQIAGAISGLFSSSGTGGVAGAAGGAGASGGITDLLSMGTSFLPGGSVTGMINEAAAWAAPSLFSTTSGYMEAAGTELLKAGVTGTAPATTPAPGTFTSYFGAPALGAGIGSFASPYINNLLGLQNNKGSQIGSTVGGLGATAVLGTMAATNFWNPGGWVAGILAAVSSILGGSVGSLFGGRKTHASVYSQMTDMGYVRDAQAYTDSFMSGAWYDRADASNAQGFATAIGEAAAQTAGNILDLAATLPDEYRANVEKALTTADWSAGRGISGSEWNFQWWKEGIAEERIADAVKDLFEQMGHGANKAFSEAGIGDLFSSFDLSTEEGFTKATNAVNSIKAISTAIDQIKTPTTEAEQQAKAFMEQVKALAESVKANGLNAEYADKLVGEYRTAYVDSYVKSLEEMFNPLSEIETQAKNYKNTIDGYVAALTTMSASEAQLAKVRGYTQKAIDSIVGSLDAAFFPLSDVEKQTKSTVELLTAYENALKTLSDTGNGLAKVDEARAKVQSDLLDKARAYVSTTPEIISQAAAMNAEFDDLRHAMLEAGNATADLIELEQNRAQAVAAMQAEYVRSFDQSMSQRYAALNGTSDAVSRAISQENELRDTIKKFGEGSAQVSQLLHLQAAENVAAAQATVNSLQGQLNSLKQQAIQIEISSINEQLSAAKTLKEAWERLSKSLYDSRVKLWTSDADALGLFARRDAAQAEFDRLYSLTISGDSASGAELAASGDTLLALLKQTSANSSEYTDGFWNVEQKLKDAEAVAGKQLSEAQKSYNTLESQLKAQQSMLDALGVNNNSLEAINAQIVTVGNQLANALATLKTAQSGAGGGGSVVISSGSDVPGFVQSDYDWMQSVAQAKAEAMNAGYTLAPGQTAGGWTASSVMQAIKDAGFLNVYDWYDKHGYAEGFRGDTFTGYALGGLTPLNEMFSVGEAGKEYMLSPSQYVVLNNSMTRKLDDLQMLSRQMRQPVIDYRLMQMPAWGTDGDTAALLVKLIEEVKALRSENQQLRVSTQRIVKATEITADYIEQNYMESAQ